MDKSYHFFIRTAFFDLKEEHAIVINKLMGWRIKWIMHQMNQKK